MKKISQWFKGNSNQNSNAQQQPIFQQQQSYQNQQFQHQQPMNYQHPQQQIQFEQYLQEGALIKREKTTNTTKIENVNDIINLEIKSRFSKIQKVNESQIIPVLFNLTAKEVEMDQNRPGIDLIIAIDVSGSMAGDKINLVKETLLFLVDELKEIDRLCLIEFETNVNILAKLNPMTEQNKINYKKIVNSLYTKDMTNIRGAIETSMNQIVQRKEPNEITSIFLLSDGMDTCGNSLNSIFEIMKILNEKINEKKIEYQIHSFGYGQDHDEKVLSGISDFQNGKFYYISKNELVDECFLDCLGNLMTVLGKEAKIQINTGDNVTIEETMGLNWEKENDKNAVIKVKTIVSDQNKNYLATFKIEKIPENAEEILLLTAVLSFSSDQGLQTKQVQLKLIISNDNKLGEINQDVEEAWQKIQADKIVKDFQDLKIQGKIKEAEEKVTTFKNQIQQNDHVSQDFKGKIDKIIEIEKLQDEKYQKVCEKVMLNDDYAPEQKEMNFRFQNVCSQNLVSKKKK